MALGDVDHVECDHHRHAQLQHLGRQVQIALQIGGIDNRHNYGRARFSHLLTEDDVHGHHFVGAARRQAVGARQVDQIEIPPLAGAGTFLGFDGDAGIVADALTHAGQSVK